MGCTNGLFVLQCDYECPSIKPLLETKKTMLSRLTSTYDPLETIYNNNSWKMHDYGSLDKGVKTGMTLFQTVLQKNSRNGDWN